MAARTAAPAPASARPVAMVAPVLGVRVPDVPGGLAHLLEFLDENGVNVEYGYCFTANDGSAVDVLKVSDATDIEAKLAGAGFKLVAPEEIYAVDEL